jgi:thiosulfate dehydrogenase
MFKKRYYFIGFSIIIGYGIYFLYTCATKSMYKMDSSTLNRQDTSAWVGASQYQIPLDSNQQGPLIRYGYELIAHTSKYLGPHGVVQHSTNGMNCQNCHLEAGTKPWGLNYGSVFSTYPKFRERSGTVESIYKRINDCMERSLNGRALDTNSKEMKAIYAYIKWLGQGVPRGKKVKGSGIEQIKYLEIPANPSNGLMVYTQNCQKCHGLNGEGVMNKEGNMYEYPPLWGPHSYNDAAGINQLSKLAGFIKNNMPNTVNYRNPTLTTQQSWDVAAYISSHPRPTKDKSKDWPLLATKPFDYPYGPYADTFSVKQHKYGPFGPILAMRMKK